MIATAYYAQFNLNSDIDGNYNYNLTFDKDGTIEHYTVKLIDTTRLGRIWVNYDGNNHHLTVKTKNIKELTIDCRSIAEEKSKEILNVDYSVDENFYKEYFIDKQKFIVSVNTDNEIGLILKDVPYPSRVTLDTEPLVEGSKGDYTYSLGNINTEVPEGTSQVAIYFTETGEDLYAQFHTDNVDFYHIPNRVINFNASDSKGNIIDFIWDFGDGKFGYGERTQHVYDLEDDYTVTLVVRDGNGLIDRVDHKIYVQDINENGLPDIWENIYEVFLPGADDDNDGLTNLEEYHYNTNPIEDDTDGDDISDGDEIKAGTNPLDETSTPPSKKQQEEFVPVWAYIGFIAIIFVMIVFVLLIFTNRQKLRSKILDEFEECDEPLDNKLKHGISTSKRKRKPFEISRKNIIVTKTPIKRKPRLGLIDDQPFIFKASTIPPKLYDPKTQQPQNLHKAQKLQQTVKQFQSLQQNPPDTYQDNNNFGSQRLNSHLLDDDLKLPSDKNLTSRPGAIYKCPTCDAPVGKNDEICQVCGDHFEK